MPSNKAYEKYEIVAGGGTVNFATDTQTEVYNIWSSGTINLAGNVVITDDGAAIEGQELEINYYAIVTLNAFSVTIFGYILTQAQATSGVKLKAYNIGGAYKVYVDANLNGSGQVQTTDIANKAVTVGKMADLASGNILVGVSNRPVATDVSADGAVLFGQGGGAVAAHAITGNVDVVKTGASTIGAGVIDNTMINAAAGIEVVKLEPMGDNQIITGNTGGGSIATIVTVSQDLNIANTGAATIQANAVTPSKASANLTDQPLTSLLDLAVDGGKYSITMDCNFQINDTAGNSNDAIVANCNIAIDINGTPVTGGVVSFTAGDPQNTNNNGTAVSGNNTGSAGDVINFTLTTTGGETATVTHSIGYTKLD